MQYDFSFSLSLALPLILFALGAFLLCCPAQAFYSAIFILKQFNLTQGYSGSTLEQAMRLYREDKTKFAQQHKHNIRNLRQSGVAFLAMSVIAYLLLFWF